MAIASNGAVLNTGFLYFETETLSDVLGRWEGGQAVALEAGGRRWQLAELAQEAMATYRLWL